MIAGRTVAVCSLVRRREEQPRYRLLRTAGDVILLGLFEVFSKATDAV